MHITLIGMSNIGKSHWSQKLSIESGFERIACDEWIERKLEPELVRHGYSGIRDVAKWMGQPFDPQYADTSAKYSACERAVMQDVIEKLKQPVEGKPFIIDTTGSVIYAGDDIAIQLRALSRVVYFEASTAHLSQLFKSYINNPKPVIWGNAYAPKDSEAPQDALKRCYPDLLHSRAARYQEIAHVTIPYEKHRMVGANIMSLIGGRV